MHEWKSGDLVTVVKVNKGLPVRQPREGLKLQGAAESWAGEIAGPSLIGPGWWNVQRIRSKHRAGGGTYAVPDDEIKPRTR